MGRLPPDITGPQPESAPGGGRPNAAPNVPRRTRRGREGGPHARLTTMFLARPESLPELHTALDLFFAAAVGAGAQLRPVDRLAMITAVGEIAANIVNYACAELPGAQLSLSLECTRSAIEARLEDPGRPYGATAAQGADVPRATDAPHLGLGMGIAHDVVDVLEYTRQGGRNCWRIVRRTAIRSDPPR